jgi:hypothetical protein
VLAPKSNQPVLIEFRNLVRLVELAVQ